MLPVFLDVCIYICMWSASMIIKKCYQCFSLMSVYICMWSASMIIKKCYQCFLMSVYICMWSASMIIKKCYQCFFLMSVYICMWSAPMYFLYRNNSAAHEWVGPSSPMWENTNPSARTKSNPNTSNIM